jgi:hypothetical protein
MYPRQHYETPCRLLKVFFAFVKTSRSPRRGTPRVPGAGGNPCASTSQANTKTPNQGRRDDDSPEQKERASSLKRTSSQEGNTKNPPRMQRNSQIRHALSHRESTRARWISLRNQATRPCFRYFIHHNEGEGVAPEALHR